MLHFFLHHNRSQQIDSRLVCASEQTQVWFSKDPTFQLYFPHSPSSQLSPKLSCCSFQPTLGFPPQDAAQAVFFLGVDPHLQIMPFFKVKVKTLVAQSCLTLCDPMDCSLPGFPVHRILQAGIQEEVATPSSRGYSPPRDQTQVSSTAGRCFTV